MASPSAMDSIRARMGLS